MAGLGRRTFAPGEVLTASNVMNYLMDQSVMNFAGTAARGSAIGTAVSEGMVSYLADSNALEIYNGSAWESLPKGVVPATSGGTSGKGYVQITTTQTISQGATADVTNSSIGFTAVSGRLYHVNAMCYVNNTSASGRAFLFLTNSSNTVLNKAFVNATNTSGVGVANLDYFYTGSGSITLKARFESITGNSSIGFTDAPFVLSIKDMGAV